jgi:hypothetical protein
MPVQDPKIRSFPDPIDGAFDLSSTRSNGGNGVCHGHA